MQNRAAQYVKTILRPGMNLVAPSQCGGPIWRNWFPVARTRAALLLVLSASVISPPMRWLRICSDPQSGLREGGLVPESASFRFQGEADV